MAGPSIPSASNKQVTLEDLAAAAGVGRSTVGRVIQGHPHVSAKTKEHVLAIARKLGYRPDPAISALARRRWPAGAHTGSVTIGLVYFGAGKRSSSGSDRLGCIRRDAQDRCSVLGYHLDEFRYSDFANWHRLCEVLDSRGIRGIVILAFRQELRFEFEWDRFASVFLGPENNAPHLHSVQGDFAMALHLAVAKCLDGGLRRPGIALFDHKAWGTDRPFSAQALLERKTHPEFPAIFEYGDPANRAAFKEWLRHEKPNAVIATNPWPYHWLREMQEAAHAPKFIRDCQMVLIRKPEAGIEAAYVDLCDDQQTAHAIDLVHQMLQYGKIGIPKLPLRILIPPCFVAGPTLPGVK